jgi:hypothetical protein
MASSKAYSVRREIYDEKVLQEYADDLYQQAKGIIVWTAIRYGLGVFIASWVFIMAVAASQRNIGSDATSSAMALSLFLAILGVLAGIGAGRRKAFMLKLQAQQVLCQRQTEINTRK